MTILGKRVGFEAVKTFDLATLSASYQLVGTVLANASVYLRIKNTSAVAVTISFDGVTDHDIIPAGEAVPYNFGSNAQSTAGDNRFALAKGTGIYAKGAAAGGAGTLLIVTSIYQAG